MNNELRDKIKRIEALALQYMREYRSSSLVKKLVNSPLVLKESEAIDDAKEKKSAIWKSTENH